MSKFILPLIVLNPYHTDAGGLFKNCIAYSIVKLKTLEIINIFVKVKILSVGEGEMLPKQEKFYKGLIKLDSHRTAL